MSTEICELIAELTNSKKLLEVIAGKKEGEGFDMCKALDDLYNEGVERGIERGIERGRAEGMM